MSFLFIYFFSIILSLPLNDDRLSINTIEFKIVKKGNSDRRYIWLHGDEQTAKMALENHMKKSNGTAFYIINELREVSFHEGLIDPNRIFSRNGTRNTLIKYNTNLSSKRINDILDEIDFGRENFLDEFLLFSFSNSYYCISIIIL